MARRRSFPTSGMAIAALWLLWLVCLGGPGWASFSAHPVAEAALTLGNEIPPTQFLHEVVGHGCVQLSPSSSGYYFESGFDTGVSRTRCPTGGMCQCRRFDDCQSGGCQRVYECNDTESNGCVAISNCTQTVFETTFEVVVDCREPLDERDEAGIDFFGMRWKQALAEDCSIGRVSRSRACVYVV
ncbi:hypothetical protein PTSG_13186 [Salpingoeca rosetta]|uniref:EB domain-containing protein n=1 Tax=Salpingoeca rosetta (strain ATCC 50818 / BSB-021) TaxID=946362 RepID=F2UTA5_SALR5|nr:uncharacterized protein PTSG_13186 [Salpingoeca rosetta]EGD81861.1 hypothetical protein PTSG_13186 [Salpingoeca rosetta]|eukprot:XP_004987602.1 hypothetical protein PTSG_13186 [Salpingoeca rosetta]